MVSQQTIDILIRAEDRATAIMEKVELQLSNIRKLALGMNNSFNTASSGANRLGNSLMKVNPYQLRKVQETSLLVQAALLLVAKNIQAVQNALGRTNGSNIKQIERDVKQVDAALISTKESVNQFDRALDTIDVRAISVVDTQTNKLKERFLSIIPSAQEVKTKLKSISDINFSGLTSKIDRVKESLFGVSGASKSASQSFTKFDAESRSAGAGLGFLRSIASMTVGMIGYDLVFGFVEFGRAAINAQNQLDYFAGRLKMSGSEISNFNSYLDNMQKEFRKVDMTAVGAAAEEMAVKLQLPKSSIEDLTKVTAVMSSAFVKEGRTQEDAILAVSDALDGQFRRLQELGITEEMLKNNGWNGDLEDKNSLLQAMNKTLDEMGFTDTAKDITSLDEAFQALSVSGGDLLASVLIPLTPVLVSIMEIAILAFDAIGDIIGGLQSVFGSMPDWAQIAIGVTALGLSFALVGAYIQLSLIPSLEKGALALITWVAETIGVDIANMTLSASFMAVASSVWAALAPLLPFIAAAAIIVAAVYEIGKAFNWWHDVGSMLDAIWAGLQRIWSAFINHPDVQAILKAIGDAWNWVVSGITWAWNALMNWLGLATGGEFDIVRAIIESIGFAWNAITFPIRVVISVVQYLIGVFQQLSGGFDFVGAAIQALTVAFNVLTFPIRVVIGVFQFLWGVFGQVASAIQAMYDQFGIIGAIVGIITSPIQFIINIIRGIVCILLGCSPGIVPALEKVGEVFSEVFNAIASFIGSVISTIVNAIQPLIDIFTQIVEYIVELFMPVWELIAQVLTAIVDTVLQVIGVFQDFLSGQITLPQLLQMVWNTILTTWTSIFTLIFNFLVAWGTQVLNTVVTVASNLVNGFISFISQLPGKVWNWLVQTSNRILTALTQAVNYARNKASEIVNGVISFISQLPGKVFNEFINIGKRMLEAGSQLVERAKKIGEDIVKGILGAMGIHSPGDIQEAVVNEFETMVDKIKNIKGKAGEYAAQVGQAIVDKFGTPELSLNTDDLMPYTDLDVNPLENLDMGNMDLSGFSEATGMTDTTNTMIGESYTDLAGMMSSTLNNMVLNDQLAYGQIQSNDLSTFNAIKTGLQNSLTFMGNNLKTQLNLMSLTHKFAMDSANNTTKTQLASMLNQTTKVVGEMKSAWSIMASSIISAAARIKNESTSYFNQLASTIGSFYQKLQNPSRWGGSPDEAPRRPIGRPGNNLMSRITTGMANAIRRDTQAPSNVSVRSAKKYVTLSPGILEYLGLNNSDNVSVSDLIRGGLINPLQLAMLPSSGWADTANPNIKHIKNKAREWSMKGPAIMGRINTGLAFKVKEFENGKPSISFASFQRMGEALFSAIPYKFYYDSDWMGSWQAAIQAGACNCWDGAHALLALARTCGFNGSIAHGTWNGYPHVYAIINGKKMDTTGWQQRRDWNGVSAGAPRNPLRFRRAQNMDRSSIIDELLSLFDDGDKPSSGAGSIANVEEVKLTLEHNVNVNVEGNTEEIDTNALIEELTASVSDRNLIDKIADALIKRDKRIARMGGA